MNNSSSRILSVSEVTESIPQQLMNKIAKELAHAIRVNLCIYNCAYVTHTTVYVTSAELRYIDYVLETIKPAYQENGWYIRSHQSEPNFFELYVTNNPKLLAPFNVRAFAEATGFADMDDEIPNVTTVETRIEYAEKLAIFLRDSYGQGVKVECVKTSHQGPFVRFVGKKGFCIYPAEMVGYEMQFSVKELGSGHDLGRGDLRRVVSILNNY